MKKPELRLLFFLIVVVCSRTASGQNSDSISFLTLSEFYGQIMANHPLARQAGLLSTQARQEIRFARGNFDPKLEASYATKDFQDKNYFNTITAALALPTRTPVTTKIGFEKRTGQFLDPSENIPGDRQLMAGISVPLVRGVITDERRTMLRQAELMTTMLEAEQVKLINKLLLEAASAYWNWHYREQSFQLFTSAAGLAGEILNRVKLNFDQGEASVLDTVQASITWQMRKVEQQEALNQLQNARITVSNFIWDENILPLQLTGNTRPVGFDNKRRILPAELTDLTAQARERHPELIKLRTKYDQLEFERVLAREFMKPKLDLQYALLSQPGNAQWIDPVNDFKLGLDFSMSLWLRKERAKLKMTDLKLLNTDFETRQQERDIENNILKYFNDLTNTVAVLERQALMADSYEKLIQGELLNLQNGESDLFKINIQQEKLIQAREKLLKLEAEYEKQKAYLYWAAGVTPVAN
jgi:outer membrane protein TolC